MRSTFCLVLLSILVSPLGAQKPPKDATKPKDAPKAAKEKDSAKGAQDPANTEAAKTAEEMKAKGFVEVDGIWVDKDRVADAKRGLFHFDGQRVTKDEYRAMSAGKVRHPITGELIVADAVERARARSFPIDQDGRWVEEKDADKFHSAIDSPWILTTQYYVLVSTLPIAKLESLREHADRAITRLRPVLGLCEPLPTARPTIVIAGTQDEFVKYGTNIGDETSAYGAFLAREEASMQLPNQGGLRPAVCLWDESWGPYYLPHATGLAYVNGLCVSNGCEVPMWFLHGLASLGSRFENASTGTWFCQSMVKAGGLKSLDKWWKAYGINGDMEPDAISSNLTQAGLLLDYCIQGGDKDATAALVAVTEAFQQEKGAAIEKAVKALQSQLGKQQDAIEKYLQKLLR